MSTEGSEQVEAERENRVVSGQGTQDQADLCHVPAKPSSCMCLCVPSAWAPCQVVFGPFLSGIFNVCRGMEQQLELTKALSPRPRSPLCRHLLGTPVPSLQ